MGVHLVGLEPPAELPVVSVGPFTGRRSVVARPREGVPDAEPRLVCHKGGRERTLDDCQMCPRFIGVEAGPGPGEATVCCLWSHRDPVSALMTDTSALVVVAEDTPCEEVDALAAKHGLHHLLVVAHQALVGVVCRCDLGAEHAGRPVSTVMATEIFAVHPTATLGAAASAMRTFRVSCVPVVSDGFLVGVLTTTDLANAGCWPAVHGPPAQVK
jgi:acetoin utilization protein AcuB